MKQKHISVNIEEHQEGGIKSKGINMKSLHKSMADMFGEEAVRTRSLPSRVAKTKSHSIRSAATKAREKKTLAISTKKALKADVDDLADVFGKWKM